MKSRFVWAALFLAAAGLVSAEPRTVAGKADGPLVVLVQGGAGAVRLLHGGTLVREIPASWEFAGAVILAGEADAVEWDGKAAETAAGGTDPAAWARKTLEGRSEPYRFLVKADGALEVVKAPEAGETDGETAASPEE